MSKSSPKSASSVPESVLPLDAYEHPAAAMLRERGEKYAVMAHSPRWLMLALQGKMGYFVINIVHASGADWQRIDLLAKVPIVAQAPAVRACLRLLNEINASIPAGTFMIDEEDGVMYFRQGGHFDVGDTKLQSLPIDLHYVLAILDEWLPTITTVAYGWRTMEEALGDHHGEQGPN